MRPVIGIVPLYDEEKQSYWMLPGYMKALEACLSIPVMLEKRRQTASYKASLNDIHKEDQEGGHAGN